MEDLMSVVVCPVDNRVGLHCGNYGNCLCENRSKKVVGNDQNVDDFIWS